MKRIIVLVLSVLFVGIAVQSCSKYEEGPEITLLSKKARLENRWVYLKVIKNGVDITDVQTLLEPDFVWDIKKDGTWTQLANGKNTNGTWRLSDDKVDIFFKAEGQPDEEKYQILKLKNKDLWLYETINLEYTEFHFVAQD